MNRSPERLSDRVFTEVHAFDRYQGVQQVVRLAFTIATEDIYLLTEADAGVFEPGIIHVRHNIPSVSVNVIHFTTL